MDISDRNWPVLQLILGRVVFQVGLQDAIGATGVILICLTKVHQASYHVFSRLAYISIYLLSLDKATGS